MSSLVELHKIPQSSSPRFIEENNLEIHFNYDIDLVGVIENAGLYPLYFAGTALLSLVILCRFLL